MTLVVITILNEIGETSLPDHRNLDANSIDPLTDSMDFHSDVFTPRAVIILRYLPATLGEPIIKSSPKMATLGLYAPLATLFQGV